MPSDAPYRPMTARDISLRGAVRARFSARRHIDLHRVSSAICQA
ncbi:putative leader peptide [Streptomyces sp. LZ34]